MPLSLDDVLRLGTNPSPGQLSALGLVPPQPVPLAAPGPIQAPTTPGTTPVAKMTPPAPPAPVPAMSPVTMHYHEAPPPKEAKEKEPQIPAPAADSDLKPMEVPKPSKEDTTAMVTADPLNRATEPTSAAALPAALTPQTVAPMVKPEILNAPRASMMGFASREAAPRNENLQAPVGGPRILDQPGTSAIYADEVARARDEQSHPWGTPENHPGALGKIGHVLGRIGNIAGNIVAPATMALIPGTDLYKREQQNEAERKQAGAETRETAAAGEEARATAEKGRTETEAAREKSEEPLREAQTREADARARELGATKAGKIAFHYTDEDGTETAVFEDGTEKKLSKALEKETAEKMPGLTGDELAMFPPPQREQFKSDPEYAKARQDWGQQVSKYKEAQKIREAVAGRAPLQREYNALDAANGNAPVFVTPEMLKANPGRYMPAGEASKDLKSTALVEDIRGAINNSRDAVSRMGTESFTKGQRAMLAAALSSPAGQGGQYIDSLLRENLSEAQHDYVIASFQLKENAMAMRQVLGAGQGSEDLRNAITATLPGAGTPTKEYAEKQLNAFESQLNRLSRGLPTVPLRPEVKAGGGAPAKLEKGAQRTSKKTGEVQEYDGTAWQTIKKPGQQ